MELYVDIDFSYFFCITFQDFQTSTKLTMQTMTDNRSFFLNSFTMLKT